LILCFLCTAVSAQDSTAKRIENIVIIGNNVTDDNVILREIQVGIGEFPDEEKIEISRQRLMNLFLFNRVQMNLYPHDEESVILTIEVTERLYFYPVPILTIRERDWSKWSYGLALVHSNFRGQNEKIWGGFWLGYRPGFGLRFTDQWAGDSLHLTTGFSIMRTVFDHRTIEGFEERHILAALSVGKWWGLHFNTALSLHYDQIKVPEEFRFLMQSGDSQEQTFGLALFLRYDTRDLYSYPAKGGLFTFQIFRFGLFENFNNYINTIVDVRRYIKLGPVILAGRFMQNSLFGDVPVYRLNYIGFDERIRGHFYESGEGRHIQIGSVETRFNIIPVHYFSMSLPAIPPQYLRNLKIGLSGAFFIDTGIVWDVPFQYRYDNFKTGFGFGLHVHLPYVEIFRFDYGMDRDFRGQLILEVGVVF
jgi:outer membrane protein assembly factor BamA